MKIAKLGASKVVGIDISDDSINLARQMVEDVGLLERCNFLVMDAENTTFEDKYIRYHLLQWSAASHQS